MSTATQAFSVQHLANINKNRIIGYIFNIFDAAMLIVLPEVSVRYAKFLTGRGIAQTYVNKCQKWLRYYLDFSVKYQHETASLQSLEAFLSKLNDKGQSNEARLEAKRAVQLYLDFMASTGSVDRNSKRPGKDESAPVVPKTIVREGNDGGAAPADIPTLPEPENDKRGGSSWTAQFAALENAIRIRHYSDKKATAINVAPGK